jgi:hypothetical protein
MVKISCKFATGVSQWILCDKQLEVKGRGKSHEHFELVLILHICVCKQFYTLSRKLGVLRLSCLPDLSTP